MMIDHGVIYLQRIRRNYPRVLFSNSHVLVTSLSIRPLKMILIESKFEILFVSKKQRTGQDVSHRFHQEKIYWISHGHRVQKLYTRTERKEMIEVKNVNSN